MLFYFIGVTNDDLLNFEYEAKSNDSLMKNVQDLTYSEPLIRAIAEKQIRWVTGNS